MRYEMKHTTFKGSFCEIGRQQGEIYRENGRWFRKCTDLPLYRKQRRLYEKHYPELLDEFEGIAEGGGFEKESVIAAFLTDEIEYYTSFFSLERACTIFGVRAHDETYVGRNYDWHPVTADIFGTYEVINPARKSFTAVSDMGVAGPGTAKPQYFFYNADDAVNETGLFIGLTFAYADRWRPGMSCVHVIKLIAETCGTVNEALEVFEKVPLCCPRNFFIADTGGEMAVVEHTSKKHAVRRPNDGVLIQTNHYVDSALAREDSVLVRRPTHNTFLRYYETLQSINSKKDSFAPDDITGILLKPDSHVFQNERYIATIWTLALEMKASKFRLYWDLSGDVKQRELTCAGGKRMV